VTWAVGGSVVIRLTQTGPANAVYSAVFFED
jgi:hypothetical protein